MNVRWDMVLFMFAAFVGASALLHSAINADEENRPWTAIISVIAAAVAFAIIVAGLNDPAKIITVLRAPTKGFSSAVSMQIIAAVAALFVFFKAKDNIKVALGIALVVSLCSVMSLSRIYMISTRPALNSILITIMLAALFFQTVCILNANKADVFRKAMPAVCAVYGVMAIAFAVRLKMLVPEDRILRFAEMTAGYMAPLYWGMILCTLIVPLAYAGVNAAKNKGTVASLAVSAVNAIGVFLLFMLICQTLVIEKGINNRIFF